MQYMLLIYDTEGSRTPEQMQAEMPEWFGYTAALREAGALIAGDALQPTSTATSVRIRNGDALHTDGPFAETKEQLGGYYLINAENLDEALQWAAKCPAAKFGTMEVRPVMAFEAPE